MDILRNNLHFSFWRAKKSFSHRITGDVKKGELLYIKDAFFDDNQVLFYNNNRKLVGFDTSIDERKQVGYISEQEFIDFFNSYFIWDDMANAQFEREFDNLYSEWHRKYNCKQLKELLFIFLSIIGYVICAFSSNDILISIICLFATVMSVICIVFGVKLLYQSYNYIEGKLKDSAVLKVYEVCHGDKPENE